MKGKSVASALLVLAAVVGVGVTAYFCAKETPAANEAVEEEIARRKEEKKSEKSEEEEEDKEDEDSDEIEIDLGTIDLLKIKAPKYKKTLIAGGATIICIMSGHIIQFIALSSALGGMAFWQKKYRSLDDVIRKAKGSEVYREVHQAMAKEAKESGTAKDVKASTIDKLNKKNEFITVYEPESEQFIETTPERITRARNLLLSNFGSTTFVGVNDIIRVLGGKPEKFLKNIGWTMDNEEQLEMIYYNGDNTVDFKIGTGRTGLNTDEEVLCIYYSTEPLPYDPTKEDYYMTTI